MTAADVLAACVRRGVRLSISGGEMCARAPKGAIDEALRQGLAEHKRTIVETFGNGAFPDAGLPDDVRVPASVPNTVEAITACIESQKKGGQRRDE